MCAVVLHGPVTLCPSVSNASRKQKHRVVAPTARAPHGNVVGMFGCEGVVDSAPPPAPGEFLCNSSATEIQPFLPLVLPPTLSLRLGQLHSTNVRPSRKVRTIGCLQADARIVPQGLAPGYPSPIDNDQAHRP